MLKGQTQKKTRALLSPDLRTFYKALSRTFQEPFLETCCRMTPLVCTLFIHGAGVETFPGYLNLPFCNKLGTIKRGGGTRRKAKPREDGPLETIFRDPLKMVSEEVILGRFWMFLRDLLREMGFFGGGGQNVPR